MRYWSAMVLLIGVLISSAAKADLGPPMSIEFDGTTADNQAFELDFTLVDSNKIFHSAGGDLLEGGTPYAAQFGYKASPFTNMTMSVGGNVIFSGTPPWGTLMLEARVYYDIDSSVSFYSDQIPNSFFTPFDTDGTGQTGYLDNSGNPVSVTLTHMSAAPVSGVPEPQTWTLLLAGLGLLGLLMRVRIAGAGLHDGTRRLA